MSGVKALLKGKKGKKTPQKQELPQDESDSDDLKPIEMGGLSDDQDGEPSKKPEFEFPFKRRKIAEPSSDSDNEVQELAANGIF